MDNADQPFSIATAGGGRLEIARDKKDVVFKISSADEYEAMRLYDAITNTVASTGRFVLSVEAATPKE
jgi:hypothetical protein